MAMNEIIPFKIIKAKNGYVIVRGKVSDGTVDSDHQIVDTETCNKALKQWFDSWANVRAMHGSEDGVGVGVNLEFIDNEPYLTAKIVDKNAIEKINEGVYKAFSVGISQWSQVVPDDKAECGRILVSGIDEVSLVDAPANENARFTIVKSRKNNSRITYNGQKYKLQGAKMTTTDGNDIQPIVGESKEDFEKRKGLKDCSDGKCGKCGKCGKSKKADKLTEKVTDKLTKDADTSNPDVAEAIKEMTTAINQLETIVNGTKGEDNSSNTTEGESNDDQNDQGDSSDDDSSGDSDDDSSGGSDSDSDGDSDKEDEDDTKNKMQLSRVLDEVFGKNIKLAHSLTCPFNDHKKVLEKNKKINSMPLYNSIVDENKVQEYESKFIRSFGDRNPYYKETYKVLADLNKVSRLELPEILDTHKKVTEITKKIVSRQIKDYKETLKKAMTPPPVPELKLGETGAEHPNGLPGGLQAKLPGEMPQSPDLERPLRNSPNAYPEQIGKNATAIYNSFANKLQKSLGELHDYIVASRPELCAGPSPLYTAPLGSVEANQQNNAKIGAFINVTSGTKGEITTVKGAPDNEVITKINSLEKTISSLRSDLNKAKNAKVKGVVRGTSPKNFRGKKAKANSKTRDVLESRDSTYITPFVESLMKSKRKPAQIAKLLATK